MSNIYFKLNGVSGESKDAGHQNWIDVDFYSWGTTQPNSMATGGGAGVGKAVFKDLIVQSSFDRATPSLQKFCAQGQHAAEAHLSFFKAGGTPMEFQNITLKNVFVTSVLIIGMQHGVAKVQYGFQGSLVEANYWEQQNNGSRGGESMFGFDIKANKAIL